MKFVVILCDGMADLPISELEGKTPMEAAEKPNMNFLSEIGEMGMARTIYEGLKPGSDVANLCVMGINPKECYSGRSPLEAAGLKIGLEETDITYRANFVTLSDEENYQDKTMVDYSAGEISSEESEILIEYLRKELETEDFKLYPGVSYRNLLIRKNNKKAGELTPPHDISGRKIKKYLPSDEEILSLMERSNKLLSSHPVNIKRKESGINPANSLWMWGEGTKPVLKTYKDAYNIDKGAVISAVDLIRGIGNLTGLQVIDVPGATGTVHTNFEGKRDAALKALSEGIQFLYIHIEAADESGHQGSLTDKIKSIELTDKYIVGPVYEYLKNQGEEFRLLIMPDHPTPLSTRTHSAEPVPFLIAGKEGEKYPGRIFSEKEATATGRFEEFAHRISDEILALTTKNKGGFEI